MNTLLNFKNIDRTKKSKIIDRLSAADVQTLTTELESNIDDFGVGPDFHNVFLQLNAFDHTSVMHINDMDTHFNILENNQHKFPGTCGIIGRYGDVSKLARVYWLRLQPGDYVRMHSDIAATYHHIVDRYQFFLEVPRDVITVADGELWNVYDDKKLTNAVLDFNQSDYHYYANHCKRIPFYMLVADFRP